MSAYGTIARPTTSTIPIASTYWICETRNVHKATSERPGPDTLGLTVHHLTLATARALPGLIEHLYSVFALDIEAGLTYPQETLDGQEAFESYFFAADVFVGIVCEHISEVVKLDIEQSKGDRSWQGCVAGFYYVSLFPVIHPARLRYFEQIKPNYPGRSSHVSDILRAEPGYTPIDIAYLYYLLVQICNAGFVVSPGYRGCGYGMTLGKSYLYYAPKLGYRASVFNLVYVSNTASGR